MDDRQQIALARHQAALEVLRESDSSRVPFVLYLRKFDISVLHGPSEPKREPADQMLLDALPPSVKLISVQEQGESDVFRQLFARSVPALLLGGDEEWQRNLRPVIARAELIISEFTFLSGGVIWELNTCRELQKHHQTVLIVPPPNSPFATLDDLTPLDQFPRVFWANQFFTERLHEHFVVKDLLQRMEKMAALPADERVRLYAAGQIATRFPIQYADVLAGYKAQITQWEIGAALGDDQTGKYSYHLFWDRFRLAAILGILLSSGSLTMADAAFDFAYTYLEILQGIAAGVVRVDWPGSFLTKDVVLKIAGSVPKFIGYLPENRRWALEGLAELTFDKLGLSYEAGAD